MKQKRVFLLCLICSLILLIAAATVVAGPEKTHVPQCEIDEQPGLLFVTCRDSGRDINEAFVVSVAPVVYESFWNGNLAIIKITLDDPAVPFFWCVLDEQGNEALGYYPKSITAEEK